MPRNTDVRPLDRDQLFMLSRDRSATVAHRLLSGVNDLPAHEQMAGIAVLFAVLSSRFNFAPEEMYHLGQKFLRDEKFHRKGNAQMSALIAYAHLQRTGKV